MNMENKKIKSIRIKNFKSIQDIDVNLGELTLLFGMNGMGKSSTIQTLLMCRQSEWRMDNRNVNRLYINGDLVKLGTAGDVFCENAVGYEMQFDIKYDKGENLLIFEFPQKEIHANSFKRVNAKENKLVRGPEYGKNFAYLAAEHVGPRHRYNYSNWNETDINCFGLHGEYCVPYLAMHGDKFKVPMQLCLEDAKSPFLIHQVSAWLKRVSPGVRLNTELLAAEQEAKLKISYDVKREVSNGYAPVNVGFGIPYVLPIVVAILTMPPGGLILLENPESHLHPRGQSAMAELMARAASYGIQIVCESHSDHIINGVRVAAKEKLISGENVAIQYYYKDENMNTLVESIRMDDYGNLDCYPEGLLDEWGELMSRLL